ncbi:MAG TPA: fructosamine kinase family protein [Amycolatopsis sp.]|uniref:fructosamine kinase family protein n=1 Tax=Amycolatopsis sp. TaxID=37632 RepID=UPI002B46988C|nr:fructosamine kinase family protein [Amycolatopsis sp.]HKS43779.1 fructosamine kinase family protein [Amycolatopsis sp.]
MKAAEAVERLHGGEVTDLRASGGSVFLAVLADGEVVVAKRGSGAGATTAEAAGLAWLGEHGDVRVPTVYGHDDEWIILRYVRPGVPSKRAAEELGRGLARLHLRGAPAFGSPPPGGPVDAWMGMAPMRNQAHPDWPTFYAEHRIRPYVRMCLDQGLFTTEEAATFDRLGERLPELAPREPPARLHGDAWSGNVHWSDDGAWLIDPAAHGGHREGDLAMLQLFGTPQLDRILGAYAESAEPPLAGGWRDRVELHQLFPLLMHAAVFGGGYVRQALNAARKSLRLP